MKLKITREANLIWYVAPEGQRALYPETIVLGYASVPKGGKQLMQFNQYLITNNVTSVEFLADTLRLEHADGKVERFADFDSFLLGAFHVQFGASHKPEPLKHEELPQYSFSGTAKSGAGSAKKLDWRKVSDPFLIKAWFPDKPTSDDILDLFEQNKSLKSTMLAELLKMASQKCTPTR